MSLCVVIELPMMLLLSMFFNFETGTLWCLVINENFPLHTKQPGFGMPSVVQFDKDYFIVHPTVIYNILIDNIVLHHVSTCNNSSYVHVLAQSDNLVVRNSFFSNCADILTTN